MNSLAQTLLKLSCPGVPDVYQGQEMWDFSLVDPDNRRPVDFAVRERSLTQMTAATRGQGSSNLCQNLLQHSRDGRIKLWLTARALNFRRDHQELFQRGEYTALHVTRGREEHVVAFARRLGEEAAIVAVPRFTYTLMKGKEEAPLGAVWGDSALVLPPGLAGRRIHNIFTGERFEAGESILCREIFAGFPVALFGLD
jgi:(1->4)-alpha-D-glucan 1-alpha-D-glucosylmutase